MKGNASSVRNIRVHPRFFAFFHPAAKSGGAIGLPEYPQSITST
jgi:hypothetical protein